MTSDVARAHLSRTFCEAEEQCTRPASSGQVQVLAALQRAQYGSLLALPKYISDYPVTPEPCYLIDLNARRAIALNVMTHRYMGGQTMSKVIAAVYTNGVFRPLEPVVLPEGEPVQVYVPESPPTLRERLAALEAFDAMCEELTEEQWRMFEEAAQRLVPGT